MAKKARPAVTAITEDLEPVVPKAEVIERDPQPPQHNDAFGRLKIAGFVFAVLCGWGFVLGTNKFHITAPAVFACLAYLAVLAAIVNLWRTGASAAGPKELDATWGQPLGERNALEREKKILLRSIKEAEFDAQTGKLSKVDADAMIREYRARAIEVIKYLDQLDAGRVLSTREKIELEVRARIKVDLPKKPAAAPVKGAPAAATDDRFGVADEPERPKQPKQPEQVNPPKPDPKIAAAEAKAAAARAEAEALEARAAAARAEAEAAEAKAEAAKAALASEATRTDGDAESAKGESA